MTATSPHPEQQQIENWRELELRRAGFAADDAIELARRHDVDLHRACALISNGCDPQLAVDILR